MNGQELLNLTNNKLGGYQNALDSEAMLAFINEGKDEVWAALKAQNQEYFVVGSQNTDPTADAYFPVLTTDVRDYTLPADMREVKWIEVLNVPNGTDVVFEYLDITDPEFRSARQGAGLGTASMFIAPTAPAGLTVHAVFGTIDGVNTVFTLDALPVAGLICLIFRNGVLQIQGTAYVIAGSQITFLPGYVPQVGDLLQAIFQ